MSIQSGQLNTIIEKVANHIFDVIISFDLAGFTTDMKSEHAKFTQPTILLIETTNCLFGLAKNRISNKCMLILNIISKA